MNVAVVEPASTHVAPADLSVGAPEAADQASEWIDPEGNDWFSAIYKDLTRDLVGSEAQSSPEFDHWFG
jgi:hypothetical protein